jgi:hypothetical protein
MPERFTARTLPTITGQRCVLDLPRDARPSIFGPPNV